MKTKTNLNHRKISLIIKSARILAKTDILASKKGFCKIGRLFWNEGRDV